MHGDTDQTPSESQQGRDCVIGISALFTGGQIAMGKDFEGCLKMLEAQQDPIFHLGSPVKAMIAEGEKVFCGLTNGDMCLLRIGKAMTKFPGTRAAVARLEWVSSEQSLSAHMDGSCRLWDLALCQEAAVLPVSDRDSGAEYDCVLAVTRGGKAVFGSMTGNLRIWDLEHLQQLAKTKAHEGRVWSMCLVNDSKCVTGGADNTVKVWDLHTYQELAILRGHTAEVRFLAVTNEGQCLSAANDATIRLWNLSEYSEVGCCKGESDWVRFLRVMDGSQFVCCDDSVRVLNLESLSEVRQYPLVTVSWELQKNVLFVGTTTGICMIDLHTFQVIATVDIKTYVGFVHYYEGKCACISGSVVRIVEVEQYQQMYELHGHTRYVLGTLPCGPGRLISWSVDESLRIWDTTEHREVGRLEGHSNAVYCAALTANGRCVSGSRDGFLKIWDLESMKEVPTSMKHPKPVYRIAVTADGKAISGDEGGNLFVWSLTDYAQIGVLRGHTASVNCIAVVSDEIAITGSGDSTVRVWSLTKCTALARLEGHDDTIFSIALASGERCVSASFDKTVRVWDLRTYRRLATLQGHTDVVWTVAVSANKCVSGSRDKTIVVWNLNRYQQEARFLCVSAVLKIVFITENRFVSGHGNGKVKVWDECREIATLTGHTDAIWSLCSLPNSQLASASDDKTVRLWDLGQLSYCLSHCASRELLEREARENKPVLAQLRCRMPEFRSGNPVPPPMCKKDFRPYYFNALHFCAYYNHPKVMSKYLQEGVSLLRGVYGSPLTLALERNTIECVDVLLDHLIEVALKADAWKSFQTINDDLIPLLGSGSSRLESFFAVILQAPPQQLPAFISPVVPLPYTQFATHPYVSEFEIYAPGVHGEELGKFFLSLVDCNLTAGSRESVEMLTAVVNCEKRRVLLSDYFRTLIEEKWARCFTFTLSVAIVYGAMLVCLLGVINHRSKGLCIGYLLLNGLLVLYELAQLFAMRTSYFTEGWNMVDSARGALSITWGVRNLTGSHVEKYFTLVVVMLDFIRGFTHFRSFRMTRIFVYMTFSVVAEVYSFLIILAYSVFAFGMLTSILVGEQSLSETWIKAYNMTMGYFDTTDYGALEWLVFTGATVTNIVVMMNLLISILGEAYEKAQMTMLENDLHMQASLVLEYETLMFWKRDAVCRMWVVTCNEAGTEQLEWSGKVLQITNSVHNDLSRVENEIAKKVDDAKAQAWGAEGIERKIDRLESRLVGFETKVARIEGKVTGIDQKIANISHKFAGVEEMSAKVERIEDQIKDINQKLEAVLGCLQARS